jgi:hypothetical protein
MATSTPGDAAPKRATARAGIALGKNSAKVLETRPNDHRLLCRRYNNVITTKHQDVAFPELYFDDWLLESKSIDEPRMDFGYS